MNRCPACRTSLPITPGRGRPRKYCGEACRSAYRRATALPRRLTDRATWVRAAGKRPITTAGRPASSTDSSTWATYREVLSGPGDGFGIMLGNGLGCLDLDNVTDAEARAVLAAVSEPVLYVERSISGEGVHVFIEADEGPGGHVVVGGVEVERYTQARFIRMTGDRLPV